MKYLNIILLIIISNIPKNLIGETSPSKNSLYNEISSNNYFQLKEENRSLENYFNQLSELLEVQQNQEDLKKIEKKELIEYENRLIIDLLEGCNKIEQLVKSGIPYKKDNRLEAISNVRKNISNPSFPNYEKIAKFISLYRYELDLSKSYEVYSDTLEQISQSSRYLRIGRLALYRWNSLEENIYSWNKVNSRWDIAPKKYFKTVKKIPLKIRNNSIDEVFYLPFNYNYESN